MATLRGKDGWQFDEHITIPERWRKVTGQLYLAELMSKYVFINALPGNGKALHIPFFLYLFLLDWKA